MSQIPCFRYSDDNRFPYESKDDDDEDDGLLSDLEKRLEWICSDWHDAIINDNFDEWRDVRLSIHGAIQALIYCTGRHDDRMALQLLSSMAFENSLECISRGKYEGA